MKRVLLRHLKLGEAQDGSSRHHATKEHNHRGWIEEVVSFRDAISSCANLEIWFITTAAAIAPRIVSATACSLQTQRWKRSRKLSKWVRFVLPEEQEHNRNKKSSTRYKKNRSFR